MAPLNYYNSSYIRNARNYSGSLLAPSLFISILMLIFIIISETANAQKDQGTTTIQLVKTGTTGPDGATSETDVYGATDINGNTGPAGPIVPAYSINNKQIITQRLLRQ